MYYHELTGKDWEHTKGQTQAFGHGTFLNPIYYWSYYCVIYMNPEHLRQKDTK